MPSQKSFILKGGWGWRYALGQPSFVCGPTPPPSILKLGGISPLFFPASSTTFKSSPPPQSIKVDFSVHIKLLPHTLGWGGGVSLKDGPFSAGLIRAGREVPPQFSHVWGGSRWGWDSPHVGWDNFSHYTWGGTLPFHIGVGENMSPLFGEGASGPVFVGTLIAWKVT